MVVSNMVLKVSQAKIIFAQISGKKIIISLFSKNMYNRYKSVERKEKKSKEIYVQLLIVI